MSPVVCVAPTISHCNCRLQRSSLAGTNWILPWQLCGCKSSQCTNEERTHPVRAAKELKLKFSIPTAQLFLHRYYAVKSMQRNDRFIVGCACLFLAAKVEDEPRALEDVAKWCYKIR